MMRKVVQSILRSPRKLAAAARFISPSAGPVEQTIIYKAAHLIASEKIEGDYLEFGVYSGGSFIYAYHVIKSAFDPEQEPNGPERSDEDAIEIKRVWEKMRFFAFDSFAGLPEPVGIDRRSNDFVKGKYSCPEEIFRLKIKSAAVPESKVVSVAGLFDETCGPETITKYSMKKAAIIHVDCDLYASARTALEFVQPLLTDGTIIIFDDWYCFRGNPNLGEQKAFNEWKAMLSDWSFMEYQKEGPWSNSFIATRCNFDL
jgi:O-methyltransferase